MYMKCITCMLALHAWKGGNGYRERTERPMKSLRHRRVYTYIFIHRRRRGGLGGGRGEGTEWSRNLPQHGSIFVSARITLRLAIDFLFGFSSRSDQPSLHPSRLRRPFFNFFNFQIPSSTILLLIRMRLFILSRFL